MLKELSIEIIQKCPNQCIHCSSNSSMECTEIITFESYKKIINSALQLGLETVCFSGGEPFLHPDLLRMIDYAHAMNLKSNIYTSGIVLNEQQEKTEISNEIFQRIMGKEAKIIFNIGASCPDIYDSIMGTSGCFKLLKQSVYNASNSKIITEAHFVPMKLNLAEIEEMVELCIEWRISKLSFLRLVLQGRALLNKDLIALNDQEIEGLRNRLNSIKENTEIDIRIGIPLADNHYRNECEVGTGKINIKYDGYVYPCEVFKNSNIELPYKPVSIYEQDIKSIYTESDYLNCIRKIRMEFSKKSTCENCVGQYLINHNGTSRGETGNDK